MAETSYPWNPPAAGSAIVAGQWRYLSMANGIKVPGVLIGETDELLVHGESDGLKVHVNAGRAACFGTIYENSSEFEVTLAPNSLGATRWDGIVVEWDWVAETASVKAITGTVSADGPTLTQNRSTKWQALIALVRVVNGATNTPGSDVYECRDRWASHQGDDPPGTIIDYGLTLPTVPAGYVYCGDNVHPARWYYPKLTKLCLDANFIYDSATSDNRWGYDPTNRELKFPDLRGRVTLGRLDGTDRVGAGTVDHTGATAGNTNSRRTLIWENLPKPPVDPTSRYLRGESNLFVAEAFLVNPGNNLGTVGPNNIASFGVVRVGDSDDYATDFSVAQEGMQFNKLMKVF